MDAPWKDVEGEEVNLTSPWKRKDVEIVPAQATFLPLPILISASAHGLQGVFSARHTLRHEVVLAQ